MSEPMLIWGAGAIGGTLGAAFIRAGHAVVFVDSEAAHVAAINAHGLRIAGPIFQDTVKAPAFLPGNLKRRCDRIFLCVKAHHTRAAAMALLPHLTDDGYVVSAQNGLNELVIADVVGKQRTIGCFVNFGADYLEPGVVHYSGHGTVVIGELDGAQTPHSAQLHRLMQVRLKAVLTGISGAISGEAHLRHAAVCDRAHRRQHRRRARRARYRPVLAALGLEVGAVAKANGVKAEAFNGFDPSAFAPGSPAGATDRSFDDMAAHNRLSAKSHSGIWRDLAIRKRKTEVDAQVLPVVEIGSSLGVPTPLTARLVAMIHEIEDGKRPLDLANLDDLARSAA